MDVVRAWERGLSSAQDENILQIACQEDRILLTFDTDFANIHRFPLGSYPGIILIRIKPLTVETVIPTLTAFLKNTPPEIFHQALVILTRHKVRIIKKGGLTQTIERGE